MEDSIMKKSYNKPTVKVRVTESLEHLMTVSDVVTTGLDNNPITLTPNNETQDLSLAF